MIHRIKNIARLMLGKPRPQTPENMSRFFEVGQDSRTEGFKLELRIPQEGKLFARIGNQSVINANFIFEKQSGFINVGNRTFIGGCTFICIDKIEIGNDVMFAWGSTIMDNNAHSLIWAERQNDVQDWKRGLDEGKTGYYKNWTGVKHAPIIIKDKAWIGFNCIILKGVTIGEGAVVGAGSVVTENVPDYAVVAGNPARLISYTK
jgi:acetyltransferase-like isoleucine patch superfamily enzyme